MIAAFITAPGNKRLRVGPYLVPITVASTAMSLMIALSGIEARFATWATGGSNDSLNGRLQIWQVAVDQSERNLLFGYGPTVFSPAFRAVHVTYGAGQAHGQVPQSMAEAGLLGLSALLLLWTALVVLAARSEHRRVLLPVVAIVLIHSISESPFRGGISAQTALVLIILLLVLAGQHEESAQVARQAERQTQDQRPWPPSAPLRAK
jgi:O-antigen ligase